MGRRMVGSVVCWLIVGCGGDKLPSAGEALSIGDETEGEAEDLTHGVIKVQFARSPSSPDSPFVGTAQIQVTMTYDSCFTQFYDANPNYTQEGVDGAAIFGTVDDGGEAWQDRLCAPPATGQVECSVVSIEQVLEIADQLTVTYAVTDDVENRFVAFGPLPLVDAIPEFTCEGGAPRMQISPQQIRGTDANGAVIWEGEALDEDMAAPGQGKAVVVRAARSS